MSYTTLTTTYSTLQQHITQFPQLQHILHTILTTGITVYHCSKLRVPKLRTIKLIHNMLIWTDLQSCETTYIGTLNLHDITYISIGQPIATDLMYDTIEYQQYNSISILTPTGVLELQCVNHDDCVTLYLALQYVINDSNALKRQYTTSIQQGGNLLGALFDSMYQLYDEKMVNKVLCKPTENITESNISTPLKQLHLKLHYKLKCLRRSVNDHSKTIKWTQTRSKSLNNKINELTEQNALLTDWYDTVNTTTCCL